MSEKSYERTEDELKSAIYKVVEKLSANDELSSSVSLEDVRKEFPDLDEGTITKLLNKLVYCDGELTRVDMGDFTWYMS